MKILILSLPGIGDSLMATPMIKKLRLKYPRARIDVLCMFKTVEYVFKNNKNVNNVYFLPLYTENRLKSVVKLIPFTIERYDVSILAFPAYRKEYHVVSWIIHAKKRLSHRFNKGRFTEWNFLETDLIDVDEKVHNVVNNLNLLKLLVPKIRFKNKEKISYDLILNKKDISFGKSYLKNIGWEHNDVIAIHPGSINSKAGLFKRWKIENFASIGKSAIKLKKKILIFYGPFEEGLGKKLFKLINDKKNCQLVEGTSFGQSLGILFSCRALITNDNGFAHLSNSLKVKSIVIFGPTNPMWCAPYNKKYSTVLRNAKFEPWFRNDIKVDEPPRKARNGTEQVRVNEVEDILARII